MSKLAYTIDEAVEVGAGSRTMVYEAIRRGALRARKRGKRTIILAPELTQYLENLPDYPTEAEESWRSNASPTFTKTNNLDSAKCGQLPTEPKPKIGDS